jgi:hypothetical protein
MFTIVPEHITRVKLFIEGVGLIGILKVKAAPTQVPKAGVTV